MSAMEIKAKGSVSDAKASETKSKANMSKTRRSILALRRWSAAFPTCPCCVSKVQMPEMHLFQILRFIREAHDERDDTVRHLCGSAIMTLGQLLLVYPEALTRMRMIRTKIGLNQVFQAIINMAYPMTAFPSLCDKTKNEAQSVLVVIATRGQGADVLLETDLLQRLTVAAALGHSTTDLEHGKIAVLANRIAHAWFQHRESTGNVGCIVPIACARAVQRPTTDAAEVAAATWADTVCYILPALLGHGTLLGAVRHAHAAKLAPLVWTCARTRMRIDVETRREKSIETTLKMIQMLCMLHPPDLAANIGDCTWTIPFLTMSLHRVCKQGSISDKERLVLAFADLALVATKAQRLPAGLCSFLPVIDKYMFPAIRDDDTKEFKATDLDLACMWFLGNLAEFCSVEWAIAGHRFLNPGHLARIVAIKHFPGQAKHVLDVLRFVLAPLASKRHRPG